MKRIIAASLSILMLAASTITFADPPQPPPGWGEHGWGGYHAGPDQRYERFEHFHHGWRPDGPPPRVIENRYYYDAPPPRYERVYVFQPGDRLPPEYYNERYYVHNWYDYQLPPPPPQHRWAYVDGRYVLVAVATGIIAQILLSHH